MGIKMNVKTMPVDDLHADLWSGLSIEERRIDGTEDVTLGWHAVLGRCVVSYSPCASRVEWITQKSIPERSTDEWAEIDVMLDELDRG